MILTNIEFDILDILTYKCINISACVLTYLHVICIGNVYNPSPLRYFLIIFSFNNASFFTTVGGRLHKRQIETKFKLPLLNWASIPATQIAVTMFNTLDDEKVLKTMDFSKFEETFKMKSQAGTVRWG